MLPHHFAPAYRVQLGDAGLDPRSLEIVGQDMHDALSDGNGELFAAGFGIAAQRGEGGGVFAASQ